MSTDQQHDPRIPVFNPESASRAEEARGGLPDVASADSAHGVGALEWVGMDAIDLPIRVAEGKDVLRIPARIAVVVEVPVAAHEVEIEHAVGRRGHADELGAVDGVALVHRRARRDLRRRSEHAGPGRSPDELGGSTRHPDGLLT